MTRQRLLLALTVALAVVGVALFIWARSPRINPVTFERIRPGMGEDEVEAILGSPRDPSLPWLESGEDSFYGLKTWECGPYRFVANRWPVVGGYERGWEVEGCSIEVLFGADSHVIAGTCWTWEREPSLAHRLKWMRITPAGLLERARSAFAPAATAPTKKAAHASGVVFLGIGDLQPLAARPSCVVRSGLVAPGG